MQMNWLKHTTLAAIAAGVITPGLSYAEMAPEASAQELREQMAAMQAKIAALEAKQDADWMTERRAEEVKGLIREVLNDAETRASMLQSGLSAGYDGGFFLEGGDDLGNFKLEIGGQMQFRWIANFTDEDDTGDEFDAGFQLRRTKLKFEAELYDNWAAEIVLSADREDGDVGVEDFVIEYDLGNDLSIGFGKYKLPFLREELLSSSRQLAVDRSIVTEFFTLDRSEQIQLTYSTDQLKASISLNDGLDEEFSTIGADPVDFAVTGRVDYAIIGTVKAGNRDIVAWQGDDDQLVVGAAVHYQKGDDDNADNSSESNADYLAYTIDAQFESNGLSLMGAFVGGSVDADAGVAGGDRDPFGFVVQGGYMVSDKLQPFARYEFIDPDGSAADFGAGSPVEDVHAVTLGANYFIDKHNLKITGDVVYIIEGALPGESNDNADFGNSAGSDGLGFADGINEDTVLVRLQLQLLF